MRVDSDCEGCEYCEYCDYDEAGCLNPGYFCDFDHCVEEEYEEMMPE